jgi:hypothetical protein
MAPFRIRRPRRIEAPRTTAQGQSDAHTLATSDSGSSVKEYLDRLARLVPAEALTLYFFGIGTIPPQRVRLLAVWTGICLLVVLVSRIFGTKDNAAGLPVQWPTVVLSAIAFAIWVYALGGEPFKMLKWHDPVVANLVVAGWNVIVPMIYRGN